MEKPKSFSLPFPANRTFRASNAIHVKSLETNGTPVPSFIYVSKKKGTRHPSLLLILFSLFPAMPVGLYQHLAKPDSLQHQASLLWERFIKCHKNTSGKCKWKTCCDFSFFYPIVYIHHTIFHPLSLRLLFSILTWLLFWFLASTNLIVFLSPLCEYRIAQSTPPCGHCRLGIVEKVERIMISLIMAIYVGCFPPKNDFNFL